VRIKIRKVFMASQAPTSTGVSFHFIMRKASRQSARKILAGVQIGFPNELTLDSCSLLLIMLCSCSKALRSKSKSLIKSKMGMRNSLRAQFLSDSRPLRGGIRD